MDELVVSVSEFVALINQTMEFAYPVVRVEGEVSELRISKDRWVYFNLKDETSSIKVFGTVYQLSQPIEDGMRVVVKGSPRLHKNYGFSLNMTTITPSGEGTIKRAFELLKAKLEAEGLFEEARKRPIPRIPQRIGLITSSQAAAYEDFMKILNQRWSGVEVLLANVQVQGESAPAQIVRAIRHFSQMSEPVDVIVITRGGGGMEDLIAFSTEEVARAVAASRIPTIVGVGHEVDISLADLAADVRATTPTNAAQLVVPDKQQVYQMLDSAVASMYETWKFSIGNRKQLVDSIGEKLIHSLSTTKSQLNMLIEGLGRGAQNVFGRTRSQIDVYDAKLALSNPTTILKKGYALVTDGFGKVVQKASDVRVGDSVVVKLHQGKLEAEVVNVD